MCIIFFIILFSSDGSTESHVVEPEEMVALTQELKRLKEALGRLKKVYVYTYAHVFVLSIMCQIAPQYLHFLYYTTLAIGVSI